MICLYDTHFRATVLVRSLIATSLFFFCHSSAVQLNLGIPGFNWLIVPDPGKQQQGREGWPKPGRVVDFRICWLFSNVLPDLPSPKYTPIHCVHPSHKQTPIQASSCAPASQCFPSYTEYLNNVNIWGCPVSLFPLLSVKTLWSHLWHNSSAAKPNITVFTSSQTTDFLLLKVMWVYVISLLF